jgi:hypothetical protein
MTRSPRHRKCTPALWRGLCGMPLALRLNEGLGGTEAATQSMNFHVSAPSKRLTGTDSSNCGSKLRRFTPCRAPGCESSGSQWVTVPQVLQRMFLSVRSPQMYSSVFSGWP